jgi:hypothetical protein
MTFNGFEIISYDFCLSEVRLSIFRTILYVPISSVLQIWLVGFDFMVTAR